MKLKPDKKQNVIKRRKGAITAEFAAALTILLPVVIIVGFASYEVATAFMIYNALNVCAHTAAMALAKAYGGDATYATSTTKQTALLQHITFANMVVSANQFTVQFPSSPSTATWTSTSGNIPTVVVNCTFKGGQYGLPSFPNPDPLQLGSNFSLKATATAYLE